MEKRFKYFLMITLKFCIIGHSNLEGRKNKAFQKTIYSFLMANLLIEYCLLVLAKILYL
jgi:uncharacterized membrane protein YhhN